MNQILILLLILLTSFQSIAQEDNLKVLLITGGHDFDREVFFEMLDSFQNIEFTEILHPKANDFWLGKYGDDFDLVLFYDMVQQITEEQKKGFEEKVESGIGLVFLHHSLPSYQDWEFYQQVLGGRYVEPSTDNSNPSGYQHDVRFNIQITDSKHPITSGIKDFKVFDEIYINAPVNKNIHVLAKTDHPKSMNPVVWCQQINPKSRSVYIQPGHGPEVFSDKSYRKLVIESLIWAGFR
ncbi:ThuA domain-containing protein [Aquiflexum sp.]|uniref:ThuA domain-containing protein n=1 Tax=Aquiflexum sp. TaxID=1872584 RepID=UPI003593C1C4